MRSPEFCLLRDTIASAIRPRSRHFPPHFRQDVHYFGTRAPISFCVIKFLGLKRARADAFAGI